MNITRGLLIFVIFIVIILSIVCYADNNNDIDEDVCKQMGQKANCNEFEDTEKCKECIKQYFINKAKENKE